MARQGSRWSRPRSAAVVLGAGSGGAGTDAVASWAGGVRSLGRGPAKCAETNSEARQRRIRAESSERPRAHGIGTASRTGPETRLRHRPTSHSTCHSPRHKAPSRLPSLGTSTPHVTHLSMAGTVTHVTPTAGPCVEEAGRRGDARSAALSPVTGSRLQAVLSRGPILIVQYIRHMS